MNFSGYLMADAKKWRKEREDFYIHTYGEIPPHIQEQLDYDEKKFKEITIEWRRQRDEDARSCFGPMSDDDNDDDCQNDEEDEEDAKMNNNLVKKREICNDIIITDEEFENLRLIQRGRNAYEKNIPYLLKNNDDDQEKKDWEGVIENENNIISRICKQFRKEKAIQMKNNELGLSKPKLWRGNEDELSFEGAKEDLNRWGFPGECILSFTYLMEKSLLYKTGIPSKETLRKNKKFIVRMHRKHYPNLQKIEEMRQLLYKQMETSTDFDHAIYLEFVAGKVCGSNKKCGYTLMERIERHSKIYGLTMERMYFKIKRNYCNMS